jgi:hypothetical protein
VQPDTGAARPGRSRRPALLPTLVLPSSCGASSSPGGRRRSPDRPCRSSARLSGRIGRILIPLFLHQKKVLSQLKETGL